MGLETKFSNQVVNDFLALDFCMGVGWHRQRVQGGNRHLPLLAKQI